MNDFELASAVREACLAAATAAYEDAGIQGLCHEGRWEAAMSAVQAIDLEAVANRVAAGENSSSSRPDSSHGTRTPLT